MPHNNIRNAHGERLDVAFHPGTIHDALVILGHGVTGNKDRPLLVALAEGLSAHGWPCLRMSFSGNGSSGGKFEDSNITKEAGDLKAVLATVPDFVRVCYIGHSMGGAVGVLAAAEDLRIHALVSLAGMTFTQKFLTREFSDITPGQGNMWDEPGCPLSQTYLDDLTKIDSTLAAAARVSQPWLLIHGEADDVVPPSDGEAAHAAAVSTKRWILIPDAGHSFEGQHEYLTGEIHAWLEKYLP